jgi:hypothetical protein
MHHATLIATTASGAVREINQMYSMKQNDRKRQNNPKHSENKGEETETLYDCPYQPSEPKSMQPSHQRPLHAFPVWSGRQGLSSECGVTLGLFCLEPDRVLAQGAVPPFPMEEVPSALVMIDRHNPL